jgi:hypothetical protein
MTQELEFDSWKDNRFFLHSTDLRSPLGAAQPYNQWECVLKHWDCEGDVLPNEVKNTYSPAYPHVLMVQCFIRQGSNFAFYLLGLLVFAY